MNIFLAIFYIWTFIGLGTNMIIACYPGSTKKVNVKPLKSDADIIDIFNHYFDLTLGLILMVELWPLMIFGYFTRWRT